MSRIQKSPKTAAEDPPPHYGPHATFTPPSAEPKLSVPSVGELQKLRGGRTAPFLHLVWEVHRRASLPDCLHSGAARLKTMAFVELTGRSGFVLRSGAPVLPALETIQAAVCFAEAAHASGKGRPCLIWRLEQPGRLEPRRRLGERVARLARDGLGHRGRCDSPNIPPSEKRRPCCFSWTPQCGNRSATSTTMVAKCWAVHAELHCTNKACTFAARQEKFKDTEVATGKCTLSPFCTKDADMIKAAIDSVVFHMNFATALAHVLANWHAVRMCEERRPLSKLDEKFYYSCLSAVCNGHGRRLPIRDEDLRETARIFRELWPPSFTPPDSTLLSPFSNNAARRMVTDAKNSVQAIFFRRFKRHLQGCHGLSSTVAYHTVKDILAKDCTPLDTDEDASTPSFNENAPAPNSNVVPPAPNSNKVPPAPSSNEAAPPPKTPQGDTKLILQYRPKVPRPPRGRVDDHSHLAMPLLYGLFCHIDDQHATAQPNTKLPRRFSLLPFKNGLTCSYVMMGSSCLCYLLRLARVEGVGKVKDWTEEDGDAGFREYFDVKRFEKGGWKFGGTVSTDGKGVSVLLRRPKRKRTTSEPTLPKMEDDPVIGGVDPGRNNLFTAVNNCGDALSCKTTRFYHDAYCTRSKEVIEAIYDQSSDRKANFKNTPTNKTASLPILSSYVEYLLPRLIKLLRFHMDEGFRRLKFRRHQAREKVLDNLCKEFIDPARQNTIVGLGNWGKDPGGIVKGHLVGPVKGFGKWLRRCGIVISIDEHRTSMLHHLCHMEMVAQRVKIPDKDGKMQLRESYSGRYCSYCQEKKEPRDCCVDRDDNAAWNMLTLAEQWFCNLSRPLNFRRGVDEEFFAPFSLESIGTPSTHGPQA